jgi:hypothetical protein
MFVNISLLITGTQHDTYRNSGRQVWNCQGKWSADVAA